MNEFIFLLLLFGIPGSIGFYMAKKRGKNPFLSALVSGLFPFYLVILRAEQKLKTDPKSGITNEKKR